MVGDKIVVVAGPVPAHIQEQTVAQANEWTPMTARHLVPLGFEDVVPIQASKQKENDSGS